MVDIPLQTENRSERLGASMARLVDMPEIQSDSGAAFFDRYPEGFEDFDLEALAGGDDVFMEKILANINTTPIGQVLKRIASLPEVRQAKVLQMRQQLNQGSYDESNHLEDTLDRVLEDLMT